MPDEKEQRDRNYKSMDDRFDRIEDRQDRMESKLDKVATSTDRLEQWAFNGAGDAIRRMEAASLKDAKDRIADRNGRDKERRARTYAVIGAAILFLLQNTVTIMLVVLKQGVAK